MEKSERDARDRHKAVVGELTQIDVKVRLEVAKLRQQVKSLEDTNSRLSERLEAQPSLRKYRDKCREVEALSDMVGACAVTILQFKRPNHQRMICQALSL